MMLKTGTFSINRKKDHDPSHLTLTLAKSEVPLKPLGTILQ